MRIKYSFIIPTFNRLNELRELIPTINTLNFNSDLYEIIIVDDGSNDGTEQYINSLRLANNIYYIKQTNQGPGKARNKGMKTAKGEYFIFVDSDCLIPEDYLFKVDSFLSKHPIDAFGGPDTYHPSFSPLLKAINYSMTSFIGTGGTRGSVKSVAKYYPRSFNMGLHRSVFKKIGGFGDLRHGQDMDYSARIYNAGLSVALIPEAFVYHKRRTSLWKFFKQIHNWGVTRINLAYMHAGMLKPIHLAPAVIVLIIPVLLLLTMFITLTSWVFITVLLGGLAVALTAFIQSFKMYSSVKIALLSILTLFCQVLAYGLGLINGIYQKIILRKKTAIGITKNYYK